MMIAYFNLTELFNFPNPLRPLTLQAHTLITAPLAFYRNVIFDRINQQNSCCWSRNATSSIIAREVERI